MRVWVYPEKQYEELGAERFEAQWEAFTAAAQKRYDADPQFELDPDADIQYVNHYFKTKDAAMKCARKAVDGFKTVFGGATVTRQVVDWFVEEDKVAEWKNCEEENVD